MTNSGLSRLDPPARNCQTYSRMKRHAFLALLMASTFWMQAKDAPLPSFKKLQITDQFWNGTISTKKPKFLCNPCTKAPA